MYVEMKEVVSVRRVIIIFSNQISFKKHFI